MVDENTNFSWRCVHGKKVGEFRLQYKDCIHYGLWNDLVDPTLEKRQFQECPSGIEMIITNISTGNITYRGGFGKDYFSREGWGYEFDYTDGSLVRCGYFIENKCVSVHQVFKDTKMEEFAFGCCETLKERVCVRSGEWIYDCENDIYRFVFCVC